MHGQKTLLHTKCHYTDVDKNITNTAAEIVKLRKELKEAERVRQQKEVREVINSDFNCMTWHL